MTRPCRRTTVLTVLRAAVLLCLTISMAIYWEGIVRAFPAIRTLPVQASNPGISVPNSYSPIVPPQPTVSTLFQEFPLIDPSYQNLPGRMAFKTSFGQYVFDKTQPFMSFAYRDGTSLVTHSIFYVNSTFRSPIVFSNYTIDMASLNGNHFRYSVNLRSEGAVVGTLQVGFVFDKVNRPKMSIHLNAASSLTDHGFNILWIVHGPKAFARFKAMSEGLSFENYTSVTPVSMNETQLELGLTPNPETWRTWALVDWSDSALKAKIGFGRIPLFGYISGSAAVITFPANVSAIDPTIVGQSSVGSATAESYQRHIFFDGSNYWVFFYNGSSTVYKYSSDGQTWNYVGTLWSYSATAIWYDSGSVYAVAGTSATGTTAATAYLYFRKGNVSGTSIGWGSIVTVDTRTYTDNGAVAVWSNLQDPNIAVGTDGQITTMYTWYVKSRINEGCGSVAQSQPLTRCIPYIYEGSRTLLAKKSTDVNGASWGSSASVKSDNLVHTVNCCNYFPILSPLANGVMLGIFHDAANGIIYYARSTAWSTVSIVDSAPDMWHNFGSAVSNTTQVNLVYVYSDLSLRYRSWNNGTWSGYATLAPATSSSPAISLGTRNSLNVLYVSSNTIYYRQHTILHGWGPTLTPLNATTFNSPGLLSSAVDSANGLVTGVWTEGSGPYTVKFSSFPAVQQVWSPYSDPWDQEGLIPYGEYYQNLQEYVSPYNGLLTITQTDFSIPQRGLSDNGPLAFTRVFRMPYGQPYAYENYPYADLGVGWSLDWPWMGTNYIHLTGGQGYKVTYVNGRFVNHQGEQFILTANGDGTFTLIDKSGTVYSFNSNKWLTQIQDRTQHNSITLTYSSNRLHVVTDTIGRTITLNHDANGRVTSVNAGGRIWTYNYNANGNLVSVQDPVGRVTGYEYASSFGPSYLTKITYPTGGYTSYAYAYALRIGTEVQQLHVSQQTVYLPSGRVRQETFNYG